MFPNNNFVAALQSRVLRDWNLIPWSLPSPVPKRIQFPLILSAIPEVSLQHKLMDSVVVFSWLYTWSFCILSSPRPGTLWTILLQQLFSQITCKYFLILLWLLHPAWQGSLSGTMKCVNLHFLNMLLAHLQNSEIFTWKNLSSNDICEPVLLLLLLFCFCCFLFVFYWAMLLTLLRMMFSQCFSAIDHVTVLWRLHLVSLLMLIPDNA